MPDCPDIFVWNNVPAGSSLRAQSSASDGNGSSNDYDVTVHIVLPSGATVDWVKTGLDPGPAGPLVLIAGPYGVSATLTCGPSGPTAKLRIWIEGTAFDCTWTNNAAGTSRNINGAIAVVAA